jgi:hypothetical protein
MKLSIFLYLAFFIFDILEDTPQIFYCYSCTVLHPVRMLIQSRKHVLRQFGLCVNTIECPYTKMAMPSFSSILLQGFVTSSEIGSWQN